MAGELELSGSSPGIIGQTIIVNGLDGEGNTSLFEEFLPTDPSGPLTNTLVLAGILGVGLKDILYCGNGLRPPGRSVGQEGNNQLGEHRHGPGVGNLTTNQDRDTVTFRISQRHGRTHGIAVTAVHAAISVYLNGLDVLTLAVLRSGRLYRAQRTCGDSQGQLAKAADRIVVDH